MLTREELEQWKKEHDEIIAQLDAGDYSALEGVFVEVPDYVIEWWVNLPETLNGGDKKIAYFLYGYDAPPEVETWIKSQRGVLTAFYHVERRIEELKELEVIRKIMGWW
jgi:hypothetical protein|nr:MAG TPA: hypothetical protein [Caudoviricetes sp.]